MIVDASALVAILRQESDAGALAHRLNAADRRLIHPISEYESVLAIARSSSADVGDVARTFIATLDDLDMGRIQIGEAEASAALDAFARYGKGRHPASLNMGDCFSYACAKVRGMPLLYKGEDFALTDLA